MTKRENWSSQYEFLLSCIGSFVGLGNIWRFPYLCYKNGGGAFLIPYALFMFICGVPVIYIEMAYCQFSNLSPAKAWICVPLLRGIGIGMVGLVLISSTYYNIIVAWTIYYFVASFSTTLPWTTCDNEWNTDACYLRFINNPNVTYTNNSWTGTNTTFVMTNTSVVTNTTEYRSNSSLVTLNITRKTATEEYWDNKVLERSAGIEDLGTIQWQLLLCLFAAWVMVGLCLIPGIKSSGKVMYVAATLPYLLLLILLCRAASLDGGLDGLKFYLIPKWEKLTSITVWGDAAVQMFYSMSIGGGAIGTLASYNRFHNNCQRDATVLPFVDLFTSWFSGCVIFICLGFMAKAADLSIDEVVSQGPGIAFLVYPEALSQLPLPQLWSVIFFLTLVIVGLDSQVVNIQVVVATMTDHFPKIFEKQKALLTGAICLTLFILGIPCVTQGGVYVLQIMDWYLSAIAVVLIPLFEIIGLSWFYGVDRICYDISLMLGYEISPIWKIFWKYITPLTMMMIWLFSIATLKAVSYGNYLFPDWAVGLGWSVAIIPIITAIIPSVLEVRRANGSTLFQKMRSAMKPHKDWGPADVKLQEIYHSPDMSESVALRYNLKGSNE